MLLRSAATTEILSTGARLKSYNVSAGIPRPLRRSPSPAFAVVAVVSDLVDLPQYFALQALRSLLSHERYYR